MTINVSELAAAMSVDPYDELAGTVAGDFIDDVVRAPRRAVAGAGPDT